MRACMCQAAEELRKRVQELRVRESPPYERAFFNKAFMRTTFRNGEVGAFVLVVDSFHSLADDYHMDRRHAEWMGRTQMLALMPTLASEACAPHVLRTIDTYSPACEALLVTVVRPNDVCAVACVTTYPWVPVLDDLSESGRVRRMLHGCIECRTMLPRVCTFVSVPHKRPSAVMEQELAAAEVKANADAMARASTLPADDAGAASAPSATGVSGTTATIETVAVSLSLRTADDALMQNHVCATVEGATRFFRCGLCQVVRFCSRECARLAMHARTGRHRVCYGTVMTILDRTIWAERVILDWKEVAGLAHLTLGNPTEADEYDPLEPLRDEVHFHRLEQRYRERTARREAGRHAYGDADSSMGDAGDYDAGDDRRRRRLWDEDDEADDDAGGEAARDEAWSVQDYARLIAEIDADAEEAPEVTRQRLAQRRARRLSLGGGGSGESHVARPGHYIQNQQSRRNDRVEAELELYLAATRRTQDPTTAAALHAHQRANDARRGTKGAAMSGWVSTAVLLQLGGGDSGSSSKGNASTTGKSKSKRKRKTDALASALASASTDHMCDHDEAGAERGRNSESSRPPRRMFELPQISVQDASVVVRKRTAIGPDRLRPGGVCRCARLHSDRGHGGIIGRGGVAACAPGAPGADPGQD